MIPVAKALSSGGSVLQSETDPELVRDSLPFILVMYEMTLAARPDDPDLLLAASRAFTMYSYGFLMTEAEMADRNDFKKATEIRRRAAALFLRARKYALLALEEKHPGFTNALANDYAEAILMTDKEDTDFLYWCGASGAAALTAAKNDLNLLTLLTSSAAMMERVLGLDDEYGGGAAHDFFISYYGGRPEAMGGRVDKARKHFERSLEISGGLNAGTFVALATSVSIKNQDISEFRELLNKALVIDVNKQPENRLPNLIMQRKARWLLENTEDFFVGD